MWVLEVGLRTVAPPPRPARVTINPSASSNRNPSRTVARDTPNWSVNSFSDGSALPSGNSPSSTAARICWASSSEAFWIRNRPKEVRMEVGSVFISEVR